MGNRVVSVGDTINDSREGRREERAAVKVVTRPESLTGLPLLSVMGRVEF